MFLGSKHRHRLSSIKVCCWVPVNDVLLFAQIVHLRMDLWFSSYQQGVLSKSLLLEAAVYRTCHFTSKKKNTRSFYRNVISEWKCKRKKNICGNQKQILCLQSISVPSMKRTPFSVSILSFHISWCESHSKSVPHWSILSLMNISRKNENTELKKLMFCNPACVSEMQPVPYTAFHDEENDVQGKCPHLKQNSTRHTAVQDHSSSGDFSTH